MLSSLPNYFSLFISPRYVTFNNPVKMGSPEKSILPPLEPIPTMKPRRHCRSFFASTGIFLLVSSSLWICLARWTSQQNDSTPNVERVQQCAVDNLHFDLSFFDSAEPIAAEEFVERRDRLAKALYADGVDAFALEPGYSFQ